MGRDKALLPVGGVPMALRVADALRAAGADEVVAVGGDATALAALGLTVVPDDHPGVGPLAAIVTALAAGAAPGTPGAAPGTPGAGPDAAGAGRGRGRNAGAAGDDRPVLVVACDLVAPSPAAMRATVRALADAPGADVAVPAAGGRPQWAHAAWRPGAGAALRARLAAGERAVHRGVAAAGLVVVAAPDVAPGALADADTPADLPDEAARPE
jgi:molybdopterin-guanine dinucleotide biosynthesis protein A